MCQIFLQIVNSYSIFFRYLFFFFDEILPFHIDYATIFTVCCCVHKLRSFLTIHISMNFLFYIKLYLLTIPIFFSIDLLWLGMIAKGFYRNNLGHLLSPQVNWPAAIIFYLIYIAGIIIFAVLPGLEKHSFGRAALLGALFGFFTYMTYELTNLALIKNWPFNVVVIDILWGVFLCLSVSSLSFTIARWLK